MKTLTKKQIEKRFHKMMVWVWSQGEVIEASRTSVSGRRNHALATALRLRIAEWKRKHP